MNRIIVLVVHKVIKLSSDEEAGQLEYIGEKIRGISQLDLFGSSISLSKTGKQLVVGTLSFIDESK